MFDFDKDVEEFDKRSSSDEDIFDFKKKSKPAGNKLGNLFADEESAPPRSLSPASGSSKSQTLFASTIHGFEKRGGSFVPLGKLGLAILKTPQAAILLLYGSDKKPVTQLVLLPSSIFSVKNEYLYFTDATGHDWSCHLDSISLLQTLLAWIVLLSRVPDFSCDVSAGEGEPLAFGDSALVNTLSYKAIDDQLQAQEETGLKLKLSTKAKEWHGSLLGMSKGGLRCILYGGKCLFLLVRRIKTPNESTSIHSDIPRNNEESNALEEAPQQNSLLQRMSRIGHAIPILATPVDQKTDEVGTSEIAEEKEVAPPKVEPQELPKTEEPPIVEKRVENDNQTGSHMKQENIPAPYEYERRPPTTDTMESLHRTIGYEIDRMQIRMEESLRRMIESSLVPIKEKLVSIERSQGRILQTMANQHGPSVSMATHTEAEPP